MICFATGGELILMLIIKLFFSGNRDARNTQNALYKMHSKFKTTRSIFIKITSLIKRDMISIYVSQITNSFNREAAVTTSFEKLGKIAPGKCFLSLLPKKLAWIKSKTREFSLCSMDYIPGFKIIWRCVVLNLELS